MLQPESRVDVETSLDVRVSLRPGQTFPPGRGVLAVNRGWSLVQVGTVSERGAEPDDKNRSSAALPVEPERISS